MCFMACYCVVTVAGLLRLALRAFRHAKIPRVYGTSRRSEALSYFGESADAYGCYETKPRWRIYVRQSRRVIFWSTKKSHGRSSNRGSNSESTVQTFICVNKLGRFRLQLGCPVGA